MVAKNLQIRQRAVNETQSMIGFNSQNLFKLPHERTFRDDVMFAEGGGLVTTGNSGDKKSKKVERNITLELLNEEEEDMSECKSVSDEQLIEQFKQHVAANKKEEDCKTIEELKELYAFQSKKQKEAEGLKSMNSFVKGMNIAFKKAQKVVDLDQGISLEHFVKIGNGVANP